MAQLHLSLPIDLQRHVDARVATEGYGGSAEFLRDLIERDRIAYAGDVARVQALIDEGIASGIVAGEPEDHVKTIMAEIVDRHG